MFDEEILATVVGDFTESESACSDEEDEGEDEKLVSTKEAAQYFKNYSTWMELQNDIDPVQFNCSYKPKFRYVAIPQSGLSYGYWVPKCSSSKKCNDWFGFFRERLIKRHQNLNIFVRIYTN